VLLGDLFSAAAIQFTMQMASLLGKIFEVRRLTNCLETAYQLQNTGAKVLLVHPSLLRTAIAAASKVGFPQEKIFQLSGDYNLPIYGIKDWRSLIPEGSDLWRWQKLTGQEAMSRIATINYSSGYASVESA
jgi:hypothetical protein